MALQVHPDKSKDERATEAFKLISEAFDTLYDVSSQEAYLISLTQPPAKRARKTSTSWKKSPTQSPTQKQSSWWQKRTMEEILRDMKRREAEEEVLRAQFKATQRTRYVAKRITRDLQNACRVCEDFDKESGILSSSFWPETEEMLAIGEQSLGEVVRYLRTSHLYCIYCGVKFTDSEDIVKNCPGSSYEEHSC